MALKKYALSNKFPPAISDLRLYAADLMETRIPDADEAWGEVNYGCKALRIYEGGGCTEKPQRSST